MRYITRLAQLAVAAAVTVAASATAEAQTITACSSNKTGSMYRIGLTGMPTNCSNNHVKETWNIQGPVGPQGPKGDPGTVALPFAATVNSAGTLFDINNSGTGVSGKFSSASGNAIQARSVSGNGIHAVSVLGGSAVAAIKAEHSQVTGTALEISRGAIKVRAAGEGTDDPAFRARGTSGNSGVHTITLDHPLLNNDPNALVFITRDVTGVVSTYKLREQFVFYQNGLWYLRYRIDAPAGWEPYSPAPRFHVLVIKT